MSDKPLPLRPGEYVTLIFMPQADHIHLSLATVITSSQTRFTVPYGSAPTDSKRNCNFLLEEEGIYWLRGQFLIGSVEVDAAITAQGLETKKS